MIFREHPDAAVHASSHIATQIDDENNQCDAASVQDDASADRQLDPDIPTPIPTSSNQILIAFDLLNEAFAESDRS